MKPSHFLALVLQAHWISSVAAYGYRGYAERAMYFIVYLMEEMNPEGVGEHKVASDCVGTRTSGLFMRNKRCNLAEFVDHFWAPMDGETERDRPPKDRIKWGSTMKGARDPVSIASLLGSAKIGDRTLEELGKSGYQGKLNMDKLWPGAGITDYYQSLGAFGERVAQIKAEWDKGMAEGKLWDPAKPIVKNPGESEDDFKKRKKDLERQVAKVNRFNELFENVKVAAIRVQDTRLADMWDHIKKDGTMDGKPSWKERFGVDPVWDNNDVNRYDKDGKLLPGQSPIAKWEVINEKATIDKMVKELGITPEEAKKRFDKVWDPIISSETYKQHRAAIVNIQKTMTDMGVGGNIRPELCPI